MIKKIIVFSLALLICLSAVVLNPNDFKVEASGGGGSGSNNNGFLNNSYIWKQLEYICDVVYDAYEENDIIKGRAFGTKGARYTIDEIINPRMNDMGLDNVQNLSIGYISSEYSDREYSSKMITEDFQLIINNASDKTYNWSQYVPKNESFPIPAGVKCYQVLPINQRLTRNYTFNNELVRKYNDIPDCPVNYPFAGTLTNYFYNITSTESTDYSLIIGNVTYLTTEEELPEDQEGQVFMIEDEEENQNKLDNMTNNSGCIIISEASRGYQNVSISNCAFPVIKVQNNTANQNNFTYISNLLDSGEWMIVDNVVDNNILTFTYNISEACLPALDDWVFIAEKPPGAWEGWGDAKEIAKYMWIWNFHVLERDLIRPICKGIILYDFADTTHFMGPTSRAWSWHKGLEKAGYSDSPALPMFSINHSVGSWLVSNRYTDTTISGYLDQEWKQQTSSSPGIIDYNVVGYRNISNNPGDKTVILSNRFDGFWGETPGDSGVGGAILLGIAKYMTDYNITPKCNITFLFTTGEEYGMRGAYHFRDSHPENDHCDYTLFLTLDQLAMNYSNDPYNLTLLLAHNSTTYSNILDEIINTTEYQDRTGYKQNVVKGGKFGGTDAAAFQQGDWKNKMDIIAIHKSQNDDLGAYWYGYHRAGMNFSEGDTLDNIDQKDVEITTELVWNITRYFCINTDCWFNNYSITLVDSDDVDSLLDTVRFDFNVTSTLPHDLAMVNSFIGSTASYPPPCVEYENINFTINRNAKSKTVNVTLSAGKPPGLFVFLGELYNSTGRIDEYIDSNGDNDNQTVYSENMFFLYPYGYGYIPPVITNVTNTPDTLGYGFNVTINADVTSTESPIDMVTVNISYPDDTLHCFNMTNTTGDTYEYVFNDTWQYGQYDYIIWAKDINGNETGSSTYSFNVSINATISVCTIKDSYGDNETINITDPPTDPSMIGYELLDNNKVLHIWNKYDDYYFNTSNGIQFSNHYNEYWSHNVFKLGYYNNYQWNLIYRTDELSGFNKNITSDDATFVNATLWKDLSYLDYDFRLAIRYYLGVDDNELTVIPYIKNIGDENIPYVLGFAWEINNISVDMTPEGDYIDINGTTYYLNQGDLDETYNNMDVPCYYVREDITDDISESLYLRWDENLDDIVTVESREGEYNAPVTLGIKIGTLSMGQEKYTSMFWHDASEAVYYFDAYSAGEAWATNPGFMTDGSTSNYASTTSNNDVELCFNNTCNGSYLGIISKVEIRAFGYYTGDQRDIILRPVFQGGDGNNHYFSPRVGSGDWSQWFDITGDNNAPGNWGWGSVKTLDCDVESGPGMWPFTLYCSKVEIRVTYTNNSDPVISNPSPADGSIGIGIQPTLNITVFDSDGDNMNISWLSNSSGSWQIFGTTNNVTDGTYSMNMSNASVNGQWWYWRVNVSDGLNYTLSDVFSFYTGYESKIKNCGSTDFKGYLLMQVQFYNNSSWVVVDDTVNETTPRTVKWADPGGTPGQEILGLDAIFNGLVNTNNLSGYGNGTYRVYVCLRDPMGNVLNAGGGVFGSQNNYLETSYEFTITYS